MTVQQIHEYIWDTVIEYIDKYNKHSIYEMATRSVDLIKIRAVDTLYDEDKIDLATHRLLCNTCSCVLCVLYRVCEACPLYREQEHKCSSFLSDYSKVLNEYDKEAAARIRNINVLSGDNPNEVAINILEGNG